MSDYLTDEEQVDRLKKLWKEWGLAAVLALVVGVGGTVGFDYWVSYQSTSAQAAADLYSEYVEAKTLGEPVTLYLEELEDEYGSSAYYVFAQMQEAKAAVDEENYEEALTHLEIADEVAEGTPIADLVAMKRARVEFQLEQFDDVLATLRRVETDGFRWQALMLKGDVHFLQEDLDLAREAYLAAKDAVPSGIDESDIVMRVASVPATS